LVEGLLSPSEHKHMVERLKAYPYSQSRVDVLQAALAETGEGPSAVQRAARYVFAVGKEALEFLRGATEPLQVPSVAWATRSARGPAAAPAESFFEFRHAFGMILAHIKVEHVAPSRLDLQLSLEEKAKPVADARVTVTRDGQVVDSLPVEESGSATLSSLEPARYELEIRRGGAVAGTLLLDFLS
jgi:hypothetical protein